MKKLLFLVLIALMVSCSEDPAEPPIEHSNPTVKSEATDTVLSEEDIVYSEGLAFDGISTSSVALPQKLDIYYPDNNSNDRPLIMFIHGGGFQGGTKTKPEIIEMANYFASRGWVFASVDYRTVEDLGTIAGMSPEELLNFFKG